MSELAKKWADTKMHITWCFNTYAEDSTCSDVPKSEDAGKFMQGMGYRDTDSIANMRSHLPAYAL